MRRKRYDLAAATHSTSFARGNHQRLERYRIELARLCAANGFDSILAADEHLDDAAHTCRSLGVNVETVVVDLATRPGVDALVTTIGDRAVDALVDNAGHGLGQPFLDQDFSEIQHVIDTNITGTLDLIHQVAGKMQERGSGRILITGSSAATAASSPATRPPKQARNRESGIRTNS